MKGRLSCPIARKQRATSNEDQIASRTFAEGVFRELVLESSCRVPIPSTEIVRSRCSSDFLADLCRGRLQEFTFESQATCTNPHQQRSQDLKLSSALPRMPDFHSMSSENLFFESQRRTTNPSDRDTRRLPNQLPPRQSR